VMVHVARQSALLVILYGIVDHVMAFAVKNVSDLVHLHVLAVKPCRIMKVHVIIVDTCASHMSTQTP